MTVLRQINQELGQTIILVTHDTAVAACVDRTLAIRDGRTSTETIRRSPAQPVAFPAIPPATPSPASAHFVEPEAVAAMSAHLVPAAPILLAQLKQVLAQSELASQLELHAVGEHFELWPIGARAVHTHAGQVTGTSSIIGLSLDSHRELVLVDRTGRLQLPGEALALIPANGRAEVRVVGDQVVLRPFVADEDHVQGTLAPVRENRPLTRMDGMQ
jgi:energy-coupling factor transporter ATP-binding protein EcfA2